MSIEVAQECLLRDARYFGLEHLEHLLSPSTDVSILPSSISTMFRGTTIYPLDRLCENGDLSLDSKVYRPFHMPKPMPVTSLPSSALFVVRGVLMQYVRSSPIVSRFRSSEFSSDQLRPPISRRFRDIVPLAGVSLRIRPLSPPPILRRPRQSHLVCTFETNWWSFGRNRLQAQRRNDHN